MSDYVTDFVRNINASRIYNLNKMVIQLNWSAHVPNHPSIISFNIYRADNYEGVFTLLTTTALVSYVDSTADLDLLSDYVYKITFTFDPGTGVEESSIDSATSTRVLYDRAPGFGGLNYHMLEEEKRRINLFLGKHLGEEVMVLLRKFVGPKCPCYDIESDRITNPSCDICYGTGLVGGYEIVKTRIFVTSGVEKIAEEAAGIHIDYKVSATVGPYPVLHSQDYIFRQDGIIYGIVDNKPERFQNHIKEQQVKLNEIRPNNPIYKFATDILSS